MTTTQVSTLGTLVPYISLEEFKRAPISNQLKRLVPNSSPNDLDGELMQIIRRISSQINDECGQNLAATVDVETGTAVVQRDGSLRLHTRGTPIIQVLSISVGRNQFDLTALPTEQMSSLVLDPWRITIPAFSSWRPGTRMWAQWSYINGFPVTSLSTAAAAGDTTITVGNATGIVAGQTSLSIEDGKYFESVVPTAVNGNVLTVAPLMSAHQAGVGVSNLPDSIKQALLLLVSRMHDSWSMSSGAISHDGTGAMRPGGGASRKLCEAGVMLAPYRRLQ